MNTLLKVICLLLLAVEAQASGGGIPVYSIINFALLATLLVLVLKRPLGDFFRQRSKTIEKEIQDAETSKKDADIIYGDYAGRMANFEDEVNRLLRDMREEGEAEKVKIIADAKAQAERLLKESEKIIEQEMLRAKEQLKLESINLSTALAKTLIQQQISDEDQARLLETSLVEMEKHA